MEQISLRLEDDLDIPLGVAEFFCLSREHGLKIIEQVKKSVSTWQQAIVPYLYHKKFVNYK